MAEEDDADVPEARDPCSRGVCIDGSPAQVSRSGEACPTGGVCAAALGCVFGKSLVLRDTRSCLVTDDGAVLCWGATGGGFPGSDAPSASAAPVKVATIPLVSALSLGPTHACGLLSRGGMACWGAASATRAVAREAPFGARGSATITSPVFAVMATRTERGRVAGLDDALGITAGDGESCALLPGGAVRCVAGGTHPLALVGHGPEPLDVGSLRGVVSIAGGATHSCAVHRDGGVLCWGAGEEGQLGDGSQRSSASVVRVTGIDRAVEVGVGGAHSCARLAGGEVYCWGYGASGELGDGQSRSSALPRQVNLLVPAAQLAIGGSHSCARLPEGRVACWGHGTFGEIGDGNETAVEPVPRTAKGISDAIDIAAGAHHTCALRRGRSVRCWGSNSDGQSGQPTSAIVPVATEISW